MITTAAKMTLKRMTLQKQKLGEAIIYSNPVDVTTNHNLHKIIIISLKIKSSRIFYKNANVP